jgi:hypothetical protein
MTGWNCWSEPFKTSPILTIALEPYDRFRSKVEHTPSFRHIEKRVLLKDNPAKRQAQNRVVVIVPKEGAAEMEVEA